MNDFGRIEHEDVFDVGNTFGDLQTGDFEFDFVDDDLFVSGVCAPNESSPDQANLFGEIEKQLLNDFDGLFDLDQTPSDAVAAADAFWSDVFVDSPPPPPVDPGSGSSSTSEASNDHRSDKFPSGQASDTNQNDGTNQNDDDNDRVGKKRERQLRNRDAAVRSRERKKMYVRDLELKSRYFEAECKRLGMMLQCSLAENHALKFSLQNSGAAFAASATKQESAVLLLESLLLGSLLWFLGITGLLILTLLLLLLLLPNLKEAVPPQVDVVGGKSRKSPVPRKVLNNIFGASVYRFSMTNKKWRGSRTRMKARALSMFTSLFMSIDLGCMCFGLVGRIISEMSWLLDFTAKLCLVDDMLTSLCMGSF